MAGGWRLTGFQGCKMQIVEPWQYEALPRCVSVAGDGVMKWKADRRAGSRSLSRHPLCVKNKFDICRERVIGIMEGNTTYGDITNVTIWERPFIYTGNIQGLEPHLNRSDVLTITYEGCVAMCGPDVELREPSSALSMVATWIFPLAIVLSLPYETFHDTYKVIKTVAATVNWLGSPQTALTATIFNFWQIKRANALRNRRLRTEDLTRHWTNAFFVLTSLSQYDIPELHPNQLETLLYGLFRPTVQGFYDEHHDGELTGQLLDQLAFQLRMLRRRAVIPTLASLGTFLVAFVFSVVLSFADTPESGSVDQLGLGLLYTWLPMLVIFTIVDRNPVSADRVRVLVERWLHNVQAIKNQRDGTSPEIRWWPTPNAPPANVFRVGRFIGQGRSVQYAGLSHAVMAELPSKGVATRTYPGDYTDLAARVHSRLQYERRRPLSWFVIALVSQVAVVAVVMLAFMLAFNTPTVGLGCWSGSFALYAILSSLTWILSLVIRRKPGRWLTGLCYFCNTLALGWLIVATLFILTGALNTCYCQTSPYGVPRFGGYMTFEPASKLRHMFNVTKYWATAAGFGLSIPVVVFFTAVYNWHKCAHLWKMPEKGNTEEAELVARGLRVDMRWTAS
ncbi:hypothetical protein V8F20_011049 [Naviculisporaceae sp. PSN 640]